MIRLIIKIGCVFFIIGGLAIPQLSAAQNFYKVRLASVYDGDTFKVYLACRYPLYCKKMSVRVNGVDCPELETKAPCEKKSRPTSQAVYGRFLKKRPYYSAQLQKG